jgi:hypothetical protein
MRTHSGSLLKTIFVKSWNATFQSQCALALSFTRRNYSAVAKPSNDQIGQGKRRWEILDKIVALPKKYDLPIIAAFVERVQVLPLGWQRQAATTLEHLFAMLRAEAIIEEWMIANADDEVIKLIAEDHPRNKAFMKNLHSICQDKYLLKRFVINEHELLPLRHIIDTVSYEGKGQSPVLQLADSCAFILKRKLNGISDCERFYSHLHNNGSIRAKV